MDTLLPAAAATARKFGTLAAAESRVNVCGFDAPRALFGRWALSPPDFNDDGLWYMRALMGARGGARRDGPLFDPTRSKRKSDATLRKLPLEPTVGDAAVAAACAPVGVLGKYGEAGGNSPPSGSCSLF